MAKYKVETDSGTYMVETEDAPEAPKEGLGDYLKETVSNIPSSAGHLIGGMAYAAMHPIDTAGNLAKTAVGIGQKMMPGGPPKFGDQTPYADAALEGLKNRYGSLDAIKNTIKTDPVGVAADASMLAGGVSGLAKGASLAADAANLPRVAGAASNLAKGAAAVSDIANPMTMPTKAIGAGSKLVGRGLAKSALKLPGRAERYGATPAEAALEQTSGVTPSAVRASAQQRLTDLNHELESLATMSGNKADLTAARQVIEDEIAKVQAANGDASDLTPMRDQLTRARPGFAGDVTPTGDIAAQQDPIKFLDMKRQFGKDYTKFDYAVPLKSSTRSVGNKAYHELSQEFNRAVPDAQPINQSIQSLVPVVEGAQRADEGAGAVQRSIDRATRPTGALAGILMGLHEKGIFGGAAVAAAQEILSSPTAKMAGARGLYGAGKALSSPLARRALTAAGEAGNASEYIDTKKPGFGQIPQFAKGGIVRKPTIALVGERGPEAIVPLTRPPKLDTPKAERHIINSLKWRAQEATTKRKIR